MTTTPEPNQNLESTGGRDLSDGTLFDVPVGRQGVRVDIDERSAATMSGILAITLAVILTVAGVVVMVKTFDKNFIDNNFVPTALSITIFTGLWIVWILLLTGLSVISPGETRVVQFFGRYLGTIRHSGLLMTIPLTSKLKMSVRVRNFETNELKVNDLEGNPVNIAAIIVWQVADTAKAAFAVEDYDEFVAVQSESALRHVASSHPYDNSVTHSETLRGSTDLIASELADEVAARIAIAGLEVVEARISSLAYAPEIAQAMLQRQQASAVIAAREKIVEGAVSMVENALTKLSERHIVELDDERKAAMVSNLLVVLCGESRTSPVINAGTLY